jgi:hypothetical protein
MCYPCRRSELLPMSPAGQPSSAARGDTPVAAFTSSLVKQPSSFPRRDCARVIHETRPDEGWAERRQTHGVRAKHSVGSAHDAADQALARRLASNNVGRSPLGAPPWRFLGSGSALPSAALPPQRVQRAPRGTGRSAWRAGPVPPEHAITSRTAGRHASLRLQDRLRTTPLDERGKSLLLQLRFEVKQ